MQSGDNPLTLPYHTRSDPFGDNEASRFNVRLLVGVIEMQSGDNPLTLPFPLSPLLLLTAAGGAHGDFGEGGFELSRYLFLGSLFFSREGGGMDLSKVGEKFFSSVRSARSLGLLPPTSDRPEVPARAAAAAAVARILAGLPPHQRHNLSSSSEELSSIYGSKPRGQSVDELEKEFFEEEFDPVRYILEQVPPEECEPVYFEEKAALRLAQLDKISERLSCHVMEHHEEMVKGMNLVRELEKDLKVANVICMNGRRHLTSSRNEVSRDLIVTDNSKRKQALLDVLPIITELRYAMDLQVALETCVEEGNFSKAFQVLPEYLQILDRLSDLYVVQEMSRGVEVWLGTTLQKLDSLLLEVCRDFNEDSYLTVVDAYALIGDASGLAEKIQSFFMQEILSESHSELRIIMQEQYVDLLLGEFKHYKTRVAHGGIRKEVQDLLLVYGIEIVAETLIEGLSRVKRCTNEGRALMSLDLQVLINGLKHFVSIDVRPKLQIVETFIKLYLSSFYKQAYYLPETEYVHWSRAHPEYNKSQIVGLINLVAMMKGWKRKTRLEVLEKIE
ncbi:hypothetical protein CASFOL_033200 [Castilleja foliolosa]|uniref:Vacuolar protein sorting-associated protein 54 N-terminal domain-containing protein n=1 Tax=Castilleja foliolosa TaxID=1961234 RepID=A0ABD3C224_9LAMI